MANLAPPPDPTTRLVHERLLVHGAVLEVAEGGEVHGALPAAHHGGAVLVVADALVHLRVQPARVPVQDTSTLVAVGHAVGPQAQHQAEQAPAV